MPGLFRFCLAGAALALCSAASASAPDPVQDGDQADIVVTGTPEEVDRQIRDFVGALTEASPRSQLRRFEMSVCPGVAGLPAEQRGLVIERMRRVALAVGMRVGGPDCRTNILLMVVDDKKSFIEALTREHPEYFGKMANAEIRRLANEPGPAAAWQLDGEPRSADGAYMGAGGAPGADFHVNRTTRKGSLISSPVRVQLHAAAVVVERGALIGLTTIQLADYAAMRTYARTDPARLPETSPPTILKVLETPMGEEVPVTMTAWDLSFLKGLYSTTGNLYAASQRSEIRRQIEEDLTGKRKARR